MVGEDRGNMNSGRELRILDFRIGIPGGNWCLVVSIRLRDAGKARFYCREN